MYYKLLLIMLLTLLPVPSSAQNVNVLSESVHWDSTLTFSEEECLGNPLLLSLPTCESFDIFERDCTRQIENLEKKEAKHLTLLELDLDALMLWQSPLTLRVLSSWEIHHHPLNL